MARFRFVAKYKLGQKVGFLDFDFMTGGIILENSYEHIQLQIGDIAKVKIFHSSPPHFEFGGFAYAWGTGRY